ncbi:hypothetical protein BH780_gp204 [Bacillus phage Eldridge]|uniref:Uncharacterized protein n=1 Tax=Bacillus phage Eldridge TaxID=1776293 RepID=A0A0Y0DBQ3_9CAUD|nr:hypothetical protein BH780_gp204 [Bacillus phage Eldridge]AMB18787.1 hypothetical protein Eldridge_0207 [Bacillus phage Eldridge]
MKYSDAKRSIKKLHNAGWYKHKGSGFYQKRWQSGDLSVMYNMSFAQIENSLFETDYIIHRYEEKALHEISKALAERHTNRRRGLTL